MGMAWGPQGFGLGWRRGKMFQAEGKTYTKTTRYGRCSVGLERGVVRIWLCPGCNKVTVITAASLFSVSCSRETQGPAHGAVLLCLFYLCLR